MAIAICCRLTVQRQVMAGVAIVYASVKKVSTFGLVHIIYLCLVGRQSSVQIDV